MSDLGIYTERQVKQMRDRLIELLRQGDKTFADKYTDKIMSHIDELYDFIANHLLENGVIVPPCKVGQTLYLVRQDTRKIIEVIVTAIIQRVTFQYAEVLIVDDNRHSLITLAYWGDRLFLTKEEAEQKLKEGGE